MPATKGETEVVTNTNILVHTRTKRGFGQSDYRSAAGDRVAIDFRGSVEAGKDCADFDHDDVAMFCPFIAIKYHRDDMRIYS